MSAETAKQFRTDGMAELDRLAIGEDAAKLGVLLAVLADVNIVLVGNPGGGKTTIGKQAHQLVAGINPENVADIPALADVTPKQIVGGISETVKRIQDPETDKEIVQAINVETKGIINPSTQWIFANEINRAAPHAVTAFLEAIENRTVTNTAGTSVLEDLHVAVATMNPGEVNSKTFRLDHAIASRFPVGVILGSEVPLDENGDPYLTDEQDTRVEDIFNGWIPAKEINTVTSLEDLENMRREANKVVIPDSLLREVGKPAVAYTLHEWARADIPEADGRMAFQLGKTVRYLAMMHGEKEVTPFEFAEGIDYQVTARFGILKPDASTEAPAAVERIQSKLGLETRR